ncbi:MAG TPA: PBP1A family penicillin-binding protein [Candidatus Dormibacteraeota bacterium]|nr:PBP1A family penicillin-binding protein [Candidatus Dormibacteraeota bacterium]
MSLPPLTVRLGGYRLFGRLAFLFLLLCSILLGAAVGLLFVYGIDLPQVQELETYHPDVITEIYADNGQQIGTFALERRILVTYDQVPPVLRNAIISTEDRHFFEGWGIDIPRILEAAVVDIREDRKAQGASTLTMQLARMLFLTPQRSFRRKIQEALLSIQIERHYTKQQIFTLYCNQVYLGNGNYGVEAASEFYFGKHLGKLTLPEAALLAAMIRGPSYYSPIEHAQRALDRRNLVLRLMYENHKISREQEQQARRQTLGLHLQYPQNDIAPYFVEEVRQWLERHFGPNAAYTEGLRVYTTLDPEKQLAAQQAVRDGLNALSRRHGWRGHLQNVLRDHPGALETYQSADWDQPIQKDEYVTALVMAVGRQTARLRIGSYHALLTPPDFAWTGFTSPTQFLKAGDLAYVKIRDIKSETARVSLEQYPQAQAALVSIENATGEIKALVGGYSFAKSKFDRATQAHRQVGSSFKIYLYSAAIQQGWTPFDTISDSPLTLISGGHPYSPHDYDDTYEGTITLRRALAASRNVAAVRLAERVGLPNVIAMARRFGITAPLPDYYPLVLGAASLTLLEHTSAFTVFPNAGVRIQPYFVRRVTTYDGRLIYEAHPKVYEVLSPQSADTMTAMLEDVVNLGTGVGAKALGRPCGGKTGTTQNWTDAWFLGFTPSLTAGVWVGNDNDQISLGRGEQGARTALPIWVEYMKGALAHSPIRQFTGVTPLEELAVTHPVQVDTPDTAPAEAARSRSQHNTLSGPALGSAAKPAGRAVSQP